MKNVGLIILMLAISTHMIASKEVNDSLLNVLDQTIQNRSTYTQLRSKKIQSLKNQKAEIKDLTERYRINQDIISLYNSFICDSAEHYIHENLSIAEKLQDEQLIIENRLSLANVYSLSGLFLQADEIHASIDYDNLPVHLKVFYCWNKIRYYENLATYVHDKKFSEEYKSKKEDYRNKVLSLLYDQSDEYRKEYAFMLQAKGSINAAIDLLTPIFEKQEPGTHGYAMAAMSLAKAYKLTSNRDKENYFLLLAAITDLQLAVKENEALLSLAINLYNQNDIYRAHNYLKVALDDALFYNARFKNSVIARVQPIIENTYLLKIEEQQSNLRLYAFLVSLLVFVLTIIIALYYKQYRTVSKSKKELRLINDELLALNKKLDETNIVKEKYIGYFMNQCAVYINKLDSYRKNVNKKIKMGQAGDLYKPSSDELEKEVEELYANFDHAFLKLFPKFIEEFNSLLKPEDRHKPEEGRLNTELRIFALIRLGITDVNQIADFLRYSVQTVYNYKSKIKSKSRVDSDQFEVEIKKIGSLSL